MKNHLIANLPPEIDEAVGIGGNALLEELRRRSATYRDGTMTARDAADVMAELRKRQSREITK